jgi:hypothetical protein
VWREWREKPREKDRLAETKRQGCAGSEDFWFSGAELDFSTLIQLWRATWGQVKFGPPLPRPRDVSVPSHPRFPHSIHAHYSRLEWTRHRALRHIISGVRFLLSLLSHLIIPGLISRMVRKRHVPSRKRMWLAWGIIALGVASGAAQDSSPAQAELSHDSSVTVRHSLHSGTHLLIPVCPDSHPFLF